MGIVWSTPAPASTNSTNNNSSMAQKQQKETPKQPKEEKVSPPKGSQNQPSMQLKPVKKGGAPGYQKKCC